MTPIEADENIFGSLSKPTPRNQSVCRMTNDDGVIPAPEQFEPLTLDVNEPLVITIPGEPISGSQLKFNRKTGSAYRPKEHKQRVFTVSEFCASVVPDNQRPFFRKGVPLSMGVEFYFPYRSQDYGTGRNEGVLKANAPIFVIGNKDIDNLLKPLKDGLKGVAINDDKQIVIYTQIVKKYSESPRTIVTLQEI